MAYSIKPVNSNGFTLLTADEQSCELQEMGRRCRDPEARRIALVLLSKGIGSPGELAPLAGVSRQVIEGWAVQIAWQRVRRLQLAKAWRVERRRGVKLAKG